MQPQQQTCSQEQPAVSDLLPIYYRGWLVAYLWYLMKAGKVVPRSQCRKVERGTGKNSSMMSSVAAQPKAPDTLHAHSRLSNVADMAQRNTTTA